MQKIESENMVGSSSQVLFQIPTRFLISNLNLFYVHVESAVNVALSMANNNIINCL
jgi:hypothetical protein